MGLNTVRWNHWVAYGSLLAGLAVLAGAFGQHALETRLPAERLRIFEVAVRYHMVHSLAIVMTGLLLRNGPHGLQKAGWAFLTGIVLFSGSLYALCLTDWGTLGIVTPIGGLAFVLGWTFLAWKFLWNSGSGA
ncbi:MAG TPA: DUF423 domain-containing protein [Planctomycetota bacterium]|nr:DUF423 domain-containing protein [Planctomycetota bacterium]